MLHRPLGDDSNGARAVFAVAVIACLLGLGRDASAQKVESEKKIRVIQQKKVVRYHRFTLTPVFAVGLNELFTRHLGVGAQAEFHVTDDFGVGAEYVKFFSSRTAFSKEITDEYRVASEYRPLNHFFGAFGTYTPIRAKFLFFGIGPIWWDVSAIVGVGALRSGYSKYGAAGSIGLALRFVLWRFLGLQVQVRDFMYYEDYRISGKFRNSVFLFAGIDVLVPFQYRYRFAK